MSKGFKVNESDKCIYYNSEMAYALSYVYM